MENVYLKVAESSKKSAHRLCKMLKRSAKLIVCLVLCFALVWGYSYKKPVEVHAVATGTAVTVVGSIVVLGILGALGINIVASQNNESVQELCNNIWVNSGLKKTVGDGIEGIKEGGRTVYNVTTDMIRAVDTEVRKAWVAADDFTAIAKYFNYFSINRDSVNVNDIQAMFVNRDMVVTLGASADWSTKNFASFTIRKIMKNETTKYLLNAEGTAYITTKAISSNYFSYSYNVTGGSTADDPSFLVSYLSNNVLVYTVLALRDDGSYRLSNINDSYFLECTGQIPASDASGDSAYKDASRDKFYWDGYSAGLHTQDEVIARLQERVGKLESDGSTTIPIANTGSNVYVDGNNKAQTQDQTVDSEVSSEAEKAEAQEANEAEGKDTSFPKPNIPDFSIPALLLKKFPFSIPWDLKNSISGLVATPVPPKFVIPFLHKSDWGINEDITVDLSQFETVATVCRWGFSVLWVVGLIFITRKLIWK